MLSSFEWGLKQGKEKECTSSCDSRNSENRWFEQETWWCLTMSDIIRRKPAEFELCLLQNSASLHWTNSSQSAAGLLIEPEHQQRHVRQSLFDYNILT